MMTKDERTLLQETHDATIETKTVLLSKGGVVDRLQTVEKAQHRFVSYKVFLLFLGSGGLLTGITKVLGLW